MTPSDLLPVLKIVFIVKKENSTQFQYGIFMLCSFHIKQFCVPVTIIIDIFHYLLCLMFLSTEVLENMTIFELEFKAYKLRLIKHACIF